MSGVWQHHWIRPRSGDPESGSVVEGWCDRTVDKTSARMGNDGAKAVLSIGKDSDERSVYSALACRPGSDYRGSRRIEWSAWVLRVDGDKEVQAARASVSIQVPRLHFVSRLRWRTAATGSTCIKGRR